MMINLDNTLTLKPRLSIHLTEKCAHRSDAHHVRLSRHAKQEERHGWGQGEGCCDPNAVRHKHNLYQSVIGLSLVGKFVTASIALNVEQNLQS
jgi:hypothetical protein